MNSELFIPFYGCNYKFKAAALMTSLLVKQEVNSTVILPP